MIKINFIEAVKAREEDKKVVYGGNAYDCFNLMLEIEKNIPLLGGRQVPIGCIIGDNSYKWVISNEKKTLSEKKIHWSDVTSGNKNVFYIYKTEDVKQHLKEFIEYFIHSDNEMFMDDEIIDKAKEIFGEDLIGGNDGDN